MIYASLTKFPVLLQYKTLISKIINFKTRLDQCIILCLNICKSMTLLQHRLILRKYNKQTVLDKTNLLTCVNSSESNLRFIFRCDLIDVYFSNVY